MRTVRSLFIASLILGVLSFDWPLPITGSGATQFVDPSIILNGNYVVTTMYAQRAILHWADWLASQGPWSVTTSKTFNAPSGDPHDYLSWAPYWWPDCSEVGNTTVLTPQQIWVTCPYVRRDGFVVGDVQFINNTGAFTTMSDAVLYSAIAWQISGSANYSTIAASFLNTWFLDPSTKMNPNINYGQVRRGPGANMGSQYGILDLRYMSKIASAILILRGGKSSDWTSDLDTQMIKWCHDMISWMTNSPLALKQAAAPNNHGTYFYSTLAALHLIINDNAGAINATSYYFQNQFLAQISANGDQPEEAKRAHPYHYRTFNIGAMVTNAAIGQYCGVNFWGQTSNSGATIQTALDFNIAQNPSPDSPAEGLPFLAQIAQASGDSSSKYISYVNRTDPAFVLQPYFLWSQPMSDLGIVALLQKNESTVLSAIGALLEPPTLTSSTAPTKATAPTAITLPLPSPATFTPSATKATSISKTVWSTSMKTTSSVKTTSKAKTTSKGTTLTAKITSTTKKTSTGKTTSIKAHKTSPTIVPTPSWLKTTVNKSQYTKPKPAKNPGSKKAGTTLTNRHCRSRLHH